MSLIIRNEKKEDERIVEEITRNAFWNLYAPGCDEHYLVHTMRNHNDFVKELDLVIELDGKIIGNIMYTKAHLINKSENVLQENLDILTFGPVSISPEYQKKGFGKKLISYSLEKVKEMEIPAVVIFGSPSNYCKYGFVSSKKYNISTEDGKFPCAMLIKVFKAEVLRKNSWCYISSDVYDLDLSHFEEYEKTFEPLEKKWQYTQEEFWIYSHSFVE